MGQILHKQQLVGTSGNVQNHWKNYSQQLSKETQPSLDKIIYHRKICTKTSLPSFSLLFLENSRFSTKETRCLEHSEENEPLKSNESNGRCFSSHLQKKNWRKPYSIESRSKKKTKKKKATWKAWKPLNRRRNRSKKTKRTQKAPEPSGLQSKKHSAGSSA